MCLCDPLKRPWIRHKIITVIPSGNWDEAEEKSGWVQVTVFSALYISLLFGFFQWVCAILKLGKHSNN